MRESLPMPRTLKVIRLVFVDEIVFCVSIILRRCKKNKNQKQPRQIDVGDWMRQLDDTVTENAAANEEIIQQVG